MTVFFTRYAELKFEVLGRHGFKVTKRQVEETVTKPEKVTPGRKGRLIAQRAISENYSQIHHLHVRGEPVFFHPMGERNAYLIRFNRWWIWVEA